MALSTQKTRTQNLNHPKRRYRNKVLLQRSLTALVGIPVILTVIWLGSPWLTLLLLIVGVAAIRELYRMTPVGIGRLPVWIGAAWVIALLLGAEAASGRDNFLVISGSVIAIGSFIGLLWFIAYYRAWGSTTRNGYVIGFVYLILGPVYVGFFLATALMLREFTSQGYPDLGRSWLLFAILVVFAVDTGAYVVGRMIGNHPMAANISPNKTWEGGVGGFLAAVGVALILGLVFNLEVATWKQVTIGAVVGVVAQWGDLAESKIKRLANLKDSGSIIPGHGGLLDRLDSILLALPAVYYMLVVWFAP